MANQSEFSPRQRNILKYVWEYLRDFGRPPTIREIGEAAGITSTSVVTYNLNKLEGWGYLEREAEVSRGLKLTEKALALYDAAQKQVNDAVNMMRVPLVGDIVAGQPVALGNEGFATYDDDDALDISMTMLPNNKADKLFALRVRGNSMIDAMVNDNDIVIMEAAHEARNGDMVAVWLPEDQEMTLKHFFREEDQVRLQPANPTMDPIYVHASNVEVQGKVVMVVRQTA